MELITDILQMKLDELKEAKEDYKIALEKNIAGADNKNIKGTLHQNLLSPDDNYVKKKYEELNAEGEEWTYEKGLQEDELIWFCNNYERIMREIKETRKACKKKEEEIKNMKLEDFQNIQRENLVMMIIGINIIYI